jgi:hypothetical protein
VSKTDEFGSEDSKKLDSWLSHPKSAALSLPTIGILGSLVSPFFHRLTPTTRLLVVVLQALLVFAVYTGFRSMMDHKQGALSAWTVRVGRVIVRVLLALSPVALLLAYYFPGNPPIIQYVFVALGIVVCGTYHEMAREYLGNFEVA